MIGHIRSGKLKAIGLAASARHPLLPDVKTFAEMGIAGVDSDNWYALFTTKGTPASEIDRVNKALRRTLENEAVKSKLLASGAVPQATSPAELGALMRSDTEKWGRVVKSKNIKPD